MAPLPRTNNTIDHFTHPHPLTLTFYNTEYLCSGCKLPGTGASYNCTSCGYFTLHKYCATCPTILPSPFFMHPQHNLVLVVRKPQAIRKNDRVCNVCMDTVEGLFYRCKLCEFDVHPLCTQLPEQLRHALHPQHPLGLHPPFGAGWCVVCRGACGSCWRYKCGVCNNFDLHLECVVKPLPPPTPGPQPQVITQQVPFYHGIQGEGTSNGTSVGIRNKGMYALVERLAIGVLTNAVFGMAGDFSSFF